MLQVSLVPSPSFFAGRRAGKESLRLFESLDSRLANPRPGTLTDIIKDRHATIAENITGGGSLVHGVMDKSFFIHRISGDIEFWRKVC